MKKICILVCLLGLVSMGSLCPTSIDRQGIKIRTWDSKLAQEVIKENASYNECGELAKSMQEKNPDSLVTIDSSEGTCKLSLIPRNKDQVTGKETFGVVCAMVNYSNDEVRFTIIPKSNPALGIKSTLVGPRGVNELVLIPGETYTVNKKNISHRIKDLNGELKVNTIKEQNMVDGKSYECISTYYRQ